LHTMTEMGLPTQLVKWTDHFVTGRRIGLAFDGEEEDLHAVETGIPQGSPTSPILFIIYLQPLFTRLQQAGLRISTPSYIDDVGLVVQSPSVQQNVKTLTTAAAIAFNWADANAVAFDDPKSELIHFSRIRDTSRADLQVQLPNGTLVKPSSCLRWLGVWLDSGLTLTNHVKIKVAAATRAFGAIRQLANTEKGLSTYAMRQLYQSCVIPVADYGSEVWWNGQETMVTKLQKVQSAAARRITGAFRTTPTNILDAEAGLLPATICLNYNQTRYRVRLLTLPPTHALIQRLPAACPVKGATVPDEEFNGSVWDEPESKTNPWPTTLIKIIAYLNTWINRNSTIDQLGETHTASVTSPEHI